MTLPTYIGALEELAVRFADEPALIDGPRRLTFAQLWARVLQCQRWLSQQGVRPGQWVGITVGQQDLHLFVRLALLRMGCSQIALPTFESEGARHAIAGRVPLSHVVHDRPDFIWPDGVAVLALSERELSGLSSVGEPPIEAVAGALLVWTSSGTTGSAKLIPFDGRKLLSMARVWPWSRSGMAKTVISIEHNLGLRMILRSLIDGRATLTSEMSSSTTIWGQCRQEGVTEMTMPLSHAQGALSVLSPGEREAGLGLSSMTLYLIGSKIPKPLVDELAAATGAEVIVVYGSSELGAISFATVECLARHPDGVGFPFSSVEVRIVDDRYQPLPAGQAGKIGLRSEACVDAYLFDEELTRRHFRDGWFYPGDVATQLSDGMLVFHGRADDMMIMGSINIFPAEIEAVAAAFPGVLDCAAFGIPSRIHGRIPGLACVASESLDADALLRHCRSVLGLRAPRKVFRVDALPRNSLGKVLRNELVDLVSQGSGGVPA